MSERNAPHAEIVPRADITATSPADQVEEREGFEPLDGVLREINSAVHTEYFSRLIVWLKQNGNAELLVLRMFATVGKSRTYYLKNSTGMTMDEMRSHIQKLIGSLPNLTSATLTVEMLRAHRSVLDDLRPYIKHVRTRPRSNAPARFQSWADAKSWRWLRRRI